MDLTVWFVFNASIILTLKSTQLLHRAASPLLFHLATVQTELDGFHYTTAATRSVCVYIFQISKESRV